MKSGAVNSLASSCFGPRVRIRLIALVFAAVTLALPPHANADSCGGELSEFEWEMNNLTLPVVAAGPFFPPSREAETLLVVSSLYRAALSMERLGKDEQCLELVAGARTKLTSLNLTTPGGLLR